MNKINLVLKDIKKSHGKKVILNNISYSFNSGKIYAILGSSGSGKTTLLNILGLLDNKYEGEIFINNELISKRKDNYELRNNHIGFIFQSYYLIDSLNVIQNIKMPLLYSKEKDSCNDDNFKNIIEKLNIEHLLTEKVNYLSGGEKQRIAIARSFINNPHLIICDEPTGNLDKDNSLGVMSLLKQFLNEEKLIIIVTHDSFLANQCDMILELKGGLLYEK
ncbi:MAG: ABC transporter ATP-binding protein [Bacilli bacterium]